MGLSVRKHQIIIINREVNMKNGFEIELLVESNIKRKIDDLERFIKNEEFLNTSLFYKIFNNNSTSIMVNINRKFGLTVSEIEKVSRKYPNLIISVRQFKNCYSDFLKDLCTSFSFIDGSLILIDPDKFI